MNTYTLNVPDSLTPLLERITDEQRRIIDSEVLRVFTDVLVAEAEPTYAFPPEGQPLSDSDLANLPPGDLEAIKQGLADIEAGRVFDGQEVLAELRFMAGRTK